MDDYFEIITNELLMIIIKIDTALNTAVNHIFEKGNIKRMVKK